MTLPNIIYVMADDMGYGDLGCFGASRIPTPNMDRIADEGVRCTDVHSASAVCTPSRYAVMTGRYCWRSGIERWVLGGFGVPLIDPAEVTVASLLKQREYATAAVGKWHLGFNWSRVDGRTTTVLDFGNPAWSVDGFDIDYSAPLSGGPTELGFDSFFGIAGSLDMAPYCFIEDDRTVGIPDREKETYYNQQRRGMQTPGWQDESVDTTFAQKAVNFIEEQTASHPDQPFFLYLTPSAPHRPCDVRPEFVIGASRAGDRGDMVVLVDWMVGQVLEALDRLGIVDNTLVMVTSDNGGRLTCADGLDYGHPTNGALRGQKADIWDGGHREPFVARWPARIAPGTQSDALICLSDLAATCAEITGADLPSDTWDDSVSFLGALTGTDQVGRDTLIHHSSRGMFALRQGSWKLVAGLGSGGFSDPIEEEPTKGGPSGQLYNLEADPAEEANLWQTHPEKVSELLDVLELQRVQGHSRIEP